MAAAQSSVAVAQQQSDSRAVLWQVPVTDARSDFGQGKEAILEAFRAHITVRAASAPGRHRGPALQVPVRHGVTTRTLRGDAVCHPTSAWL